MKGIQDMARDSPNEKYGRVGLSASLFFFGGRQLDAEM